jgi:hypothetical protein
VRRPVGPRGNLHALLTQDLAGRLDPAAIGTQFVDESGYLRRRGSSSLAKKIEAFFRISVASRSSRFSRSSSLIRACSALVTPGRSSASIWAWRTRRRRDSLPIFSFGPIAEQAAKTEPTRRDGPGPSARHAHADPGGIAWA